MPTLVPIQIEETFVSRFVAHFSVDVTRKAEAEPVLLSADVASGEGVMVIVDAISATLDAAR